MDQEKIGKFIAELRKEKKLTQEQLANKLSITDRAISKWENGLLLFKWHKYELLFLFCITFVYTHIFLNIKNN